MDLYSPLGAVCVIVGGIIVLRVFFTLWGPIDRRFAGQDKLDVSKDIQISGLKDTPVTVHFKSGAELADVVLVGYCSTHHEAPYDFKQLLLFRGSKGKNYYARISEIVYFEQTEGGASVGKAL